MVSSWKRRGVNLVAGSLLLVASLLCLLRFAGSWNGDDSLQRVQRAGVLRAGYAVSSPYVRVDENGEPAGVAVDDIRGIAGALGVSRIEWIQTSYTQLIPDLLDHRFDVTSLQIAISPEREAQVAFSLPAARIRYGVLVAHGNPHHIPGYSRLDPTSGAVVAVARGTLALKDLMKRGFSLAQMQIVTEGESGEATLRVGAAQALVRTEDSLKLIAANHPDEFEFVEDDAATVGDDLQMAYAFRPADEALRNGWNEVLLQTGKAKEGMR